MFALSGLCFASVAVSAPVTDTLTDTAPSRSPVMYSNCSVLSLPPVDGTQLTKAELLARKYAVLLDALDNNAACMQTAMKRGQAAQVASGGGVAGAGTTGSESVSDMSQPSEQATQRTANSTEGSGLGQANQPITGDSAGPCTLYQSLLDEASTPTEKAFYEAELRKYNCR